MKVLAISGSPRKGNTYKLVKKIEVGIQQFGNADFSYLHLNDLNLLTCKGCFQCIQKGSMYCPLKDDKMQIFEKLLNSDGVILATPAYNFNVSALMKNFIDRFAYLGHQPKFFKQHLLIVSTTAGTGVHEVINYLRKYVGKLWGFRSITSLGILTPPYRKTNKLEYRDTKNIDKISRSFFTKLQSKNWRPKYYHVEQFCSMRAIFTIDAMKDAFPADYKLYTSLKDQKYYYNINVNPIKYILALIQARFIKLLIKTTIEKT